MHRHLTLPLQRYEKEKVKLTISFLCEQVRKFLEETARWKREREKEKKHSESEKMKKKKKKEKKGKDKDKEDKKSRKKKKKEERKKRKNKDKLERDLEALKKSSLPDLEQLECKLNAYYAKVEKDCAALKRLESLLEFSHHNQIISISLLPSSLSYCSLDLIYNHALFLFMLLCCLQLS